MRVMILLGAVVLAACNNDQAAENQSGPAANVTAESIGTNDITAIDAVTNDAANMAEDEAAITMNEAENAATNAEDEDQRRPARTEAENSE